MSQEAKAGKPVGATNRTIAAIRFHAERVREKAGDVSLNSDHNEILGNMVDLHHKNMSQVRASLLNYRPCESRSVDQYIDWMDDFVDDSDGEEEPADSRDDCLQTRSPNLSSLLDSSDTQLPPARQGSSMVARRAVQDVDPVSLFRQMRAGTMSRTPSQHIPGCVKGAYAFLAPPPPEPDDDAESKTDSSTLRGKSFLARPSQRAGAAYDMLAQIRGANWNSDNMAGKSCKSTPGKAAEHFPITSPRSEIRSEVVLSSSLGTSLSGTAGTAGSRSFTAGPSRRAGALPGVSVNVPPILMASGDFDRVSTGQLANSASSGGFLDRLKHILKQ
ncbi:hypothetical protein VOLCADRAFT_105924 [Volvox carteri f. nagariensis]|uniref:Uncharacterized protein n=1 Tax=Volvox carteri f. nagariensis TaxID=3068 RepID=D8U4B6_VOLCA|nr:uncharacterized protein VOLCADRAFT_105924 [Volvox carteri f. nagariensis]EFJ45374.1 hypothetical protein VOLCADRAFT_105924 [Volvox carteri f. nagariensis]|eukprot:XP_002953401.1 hypothetical protein VOLCADRAFT_105924 [Volvox carteri f. nagariensis]